MEILCVAQLTLDSLSVWFFKVALLVFCVLHLTCFVFHCFEFLCLVCSVVFQVYFDKHGADQFYVYAYIYVSVYADVCVTRSPFTVRSFFLIILFALFSRFPFENVFKHIV